MVWSAAAAALDIPTTISSLNDLQYDENGKLQSHTLAYPASSSHSCGFHPQEGFTMVAVTGDAMAELFPQTTTTSAFHPDSDCWAVCLERGVDQQYVSHVMPHKRYDRKNHPPTKLFHRWVSDSCAHVEVCLINYHSKEPLILNWVKNEKEIVFHLNIQYGERNTRCFGTFLGHSFQVVDQQGNLVDQFTVEYITSRALGNMIPTFDFSNRNFTREIQSTLQNEWRRHNIVKRTFSPLGFKRGRLPDDVFASMGSFYYNNRFNKVQEEWQGKGVFVNWWERPVFFIQIPWEVRRIWQDRLRDLVEAWAGIPVEQTSLYGLRRYEEGARLLTHVDREATHAVSLIVNVAQGNLTDPWPVEVHDHADRLHEVLMEPGDVVYYESARCLHGRNRPLTGPQAYYINLFTHYRPIGDDKWYNKPNPPQTPDPVVEAMGECHLAADSDSSFYYGTVQCDDSRLGSYISPSLFTAHNGDELFDWWVRTSPTNGTATTTTTTDTAATAAADEL
jgi:hypothetical protein